MDDKKNFVCKDCNYRFKREESSTQKGCPYCGSKNVEEYKPVLATDLLDSVPNDR